MGGGFDVKGIESGFKVFSEFIKGLFFGINGGVGHSIVPHFREVDASTLTHLVQGSHDFYSVSLSLVSKVSMVIWTCQICS